MFNAITNRIGASIAKASFMWARNKGTIMIAGGLGTIGFSMYEFHKAGMNIDQILEEGKSKVEKLESSKDDLDDDDVESVDKEIKVAKRDTALKVAKNYILPATTAVVGFVLVGRGTGIIKLELENTSAALALAVKANEAMSKRADELGEETANYIKYGIKTETNEVVTLNDDGSTTVETITEAVVQDNNYGSPYAVFVPENHIAYEKHPEYMNTVVSTTERCANLKLREQNYLPWYETITALHIEDLLNDWQRAAMLVVGNTYDPDYDSRETDERKDNHIKITCIPASRPNDKYGNGMQKGYILDFNLEGNIYKKLDKLSKKSAE